MNKQMLKLAGLGIGVVSIVALLSISVFAEEKQQGRKKMHMAATSASVPAGEHSMHKMHVKKLGEALKAIDKVVKAVEAGNKAEALAELNKAKQLVAACNKAMLQMCKVKCKGEGKIVNTRCPIMGTKLDPNKVTAKLTRIYEGKKIGFCCAGCPSAWDKLSDQQKREKLGKVVAPTPKEDHSQHQH